MEILTNTFFYLEYIFWFVFVFTIIVFIHEFGHYYVARLNKVKVDIFSVGFGPSILKFKDKNDTVMADMCVSFRRLCKVCWRNVSR